MSMAVVSSGLSLMVLVIGMACYIFAEAGND